ncbi:MAG: hypothetical protein K2O85_00160 [Helicobacter sp.]|mgnify:CR=1 FL=1|nr:hypothetical protein [Helicobacter sp.]
MARAIEVCYDNGRIDREFLSKSAKRIYIARNFAELGALIARAEQDDFAPRIRAFRDEIVYHVGNSAQILADKIDAVLGWGGGECCISRNDTIAND